MTRDRGHLSAQVIWRVYWRRDAKSEWMEYATEPSEHFGLVDLRLVRTDYPHYEVELRKVTITEERLDV